MFDLTKNHSSRRATFRPTRKSKTTTFITDLGKDCKFIF